MPRVGILIASLQAGGAERAALNLLDSLLRAGVEAYLLTIDGNHEIAGSSPHGERILRLSRADIGGSTPAKMLAAPWQWWQLRRTVRRLRLETVISIVERANIFNLLGTGAPRRVISVRSHPSSLFASKQSLKRKLVQAAYAHLLTRADRIVHVSHEAAADFERLYPASSGRGQVIHNFCDVDGIRRLAEEPLPPEFAGLFHDPVVIACGRLNPEKGHWSLIRAFAEHARRDERARLVILGQGPMREALEGLRDRLGLRDRVVFPGFQANPMAWLARARVYVLPSRWEGFPNSLIEALAAGVPVVSTDCRSGPRELLAPGTDPSVKTTGLDRTPVGLLVPSPEGDDPPHDQPLTDAERLLSQAIDLALRENGLRAEAARSRVEEFRRERILPLWIELLRGAA